MKWIVAGACVVGFAIALGCGSSAGIGGGNQAPQGTITHDYTGTNAPVTVNFDASLSVDPDGTIVSYEWDFDSTMGNFTVDATGVSTSHLYPSGGLYTVALRLTDDGGKVVITTVDLNIAGNQRPDAQLTADTTSGAPILTVNFDASGSTDPDAGDTLSYQWDWDYDGTTFDIDFDTGTTAIASSDFDTEGTFTVAVRVTDDGTPAASDIATIDIIVSTGPINSDPVIDSLTADNTAPTSVPVTVTLDVTYHDDDPGDILTVEWDPDWGNHWGTFTPNATYTGLDQIQLNYAAFGVYDVAVRVSDDHGGYDIATIRIIVGGLNVDFYITDASDQHVYDAPGAPIMIDAARRATWPSEWPWFVHDNHPIVYVCSPGDTLYFHDATTPALATPDNLWDFDDGNVALDDLAPTNTYAAPGIYTVTLTECPGDGNWGMTAAVVLCYDPATQGYCVHRINEVDYTGDQGTYITSTDPQAIDTDLTQSLNLYHITGRIEHVLIQTDVSNSTYYPGLAAASNIVEAGLVLAVGRENSVGDDDEIHVYNVTKQWQHDVVNPLDPLAPTWENIIGPTPSTPVGVDLSTAYADVPGVDYSDRNEPRPYMGFYIPMTQLVEDWVNSTITNYGFIIMINDVNGHSGHYRFMQTGRCSSFISHYLEPCMIILYDQ